MSNLTNATVTIKRRTRDWKDNITSTTTVGSYSVWQEDCEALSLRRRISGAASDVKEVEKGFIALYSDIDLTDCYVTVGGEDFEIIAVERYVDEEGDFHHTEFSYA